jgi:hypothetical protein
MPTSDIRILCVHGVGRQEIDLSWQEGWKQTVTKGLQPWNPKLQPAFQFVRYEDLFEGAKLDTATIAAAILRLTASGILHGIGDLLPRRRGLAELSERARWTAGMVAQWAADERLRTRACQRIRGEIAAFDPTVVCAHSLGSLIAYDLLARDQGLLRGRTFVSLGSQIGNPFVRSVFGGRLVPLEGGHWYHLYNAGDDVFTAPIRLPPPDFEQVDTPFDLPGIGDHDALAYLGHENTVNRVWRALAPPRAPSRALARTRRALAVTRLRPVRRALLVGINDYPNPEDRLEGCVNDVFEMSAVLQELTFKPADIRVVLNERATAAGIRERLAWLLDGAAAGDIRVFFYSGHGAQIPAYGDAGEVDHLNECLVPYDFDWTPERAFLDDQFLELYSQLPYEGLTPPTTSAIGPCAGTPNGRCGSPAPSGWQRSSSSARTGTGRSTSARAAPRNGWAAGSRSGPMHAASRAPSAHTTTTGPTCRSCCRPARRRSCPTSTATG